MVRTRLDLLFPNASISLAYLGLNGLVPGGVVQNMLRMTIFVNCMERTMMARVPQLTSVAPAAVVVWRSYPPPTQIFPPNELLNLRAGESTLLSWQKMDPYGALASIHMVN